MWNLGHSWFFCLFFVYVCPIAPVLFLENDIFHLLIAFIPLSKNSWEYLYKSISGFSIIFFWSVYLFFCRYWIFLITIPISCEMKWLIPIFFFKKCFSSSNIFAFPYNCYNFIHYKNLAGILNYINPVNQLRQLICLLGWPFQFMNTVCHFICLCHFDLFHSVIWFSAYKSRVCFITNTP